MTLQTIRIATRKSPLAIWQANHVAQALIKSCPTLTVELVPMQTSGDKFLKDTLVSVGGKGLFVKELEEALLEHRADLAVHSMKDVPAQCPDGLFIAAICERENPYDALVSEKYASLSSLPQKAKIGTSSLRRQSQLLAYNPEFNIVSLRGNIQTRIAKLEAGEFDAIILAVAGLKRMNLNQHLQEILSEKTMLPSCGQGALGIECRTDDIHIQQMIAPLNHPPTELCVKSERYINALLGGNCHAPVAIHSQIIHKTKVKIQAKVASADGKTMISDEQIGHLKEIMPLAQDCAEALFRKGAKELLKINSA